MIGLMDSPIDLPGGNQLFLSQGTPIRRDIPPGPASSLEIDLLEEMIRHQGGQATRQAPETSR
jgi:hypothetical protein